MANDAFNNLNPEVLKVEMAPTNGYDLAGNIIGVAGGVVAACGVTALICKAWERISKHENACRSLERMVDDSRKEDNKS